MKEDKRRKPYNVWITVLGIAIFLLIGSIGFFIMSIGADADQRAVSSEEYCIGNCWTSHTYVYDDSIYTRSDWRDWLCRGLVVLIGAVVVIFGALVGMIYADEHYWKEGDYKLPTKKKIKKEERK